MVFSTALARWPIGVQAAVLPVGSAAVPPVSGETRDLGGAIPAAAPARIEPSLPPGRVLQDNGDGPIVSEPVVPKISPALRDLPLADLRIETCQPLPLRRMVLHYL